MASPIRCWPVDTCDELMCDRWPQSTHKQVFSLGCDYQAIMDDIKKPVSPSRVLQVCTCTATSPSLPHRQGRLGELQRTLHRPLRVHLPKAAGAVQVQVWWVYTMQACMRASLIHRDGCVSLCTPANYVEYLDNKRYSGGGVNMLPQPLSQEDQPLVREV